MREHMCVWGGGGGGIIRTFFSRICSPIEHKMVLSSAPVMLGAPFWNRVNASFSPSVLPNPFSSHLLRRAWWWRWWRCRL
jgi:hypothetical protein